MKTDVILNRLKAIKDRLALSINRYSIRTVLIAGFAAVIFSGMTTVLLTQWTASLTDRTMDRFINVDNKISDICLKSTTAMINARRHEKDFLLSYKDFGFSEARSRYISRMLTSLADIKGFMEQIRLLTNDPDFILLTKEIDREILQYHDSLLNMVEKYGMLGSMNSGIEGEMRDRAHELEAILKQQGSNILFTDLLSMRRREKDFIMRNRDVDASEFRKAAELFDADLTASGTSVEKKEELRNLNNTYRLLFERYVQTFEGIRTDKKEFLKSVQVIEPKLEKLYTASLARVASAKEDIEKTERLLWPVKAAAGLFAFVFSLFVASAVSASISRSVIEIKSFAEKIASGNLGNRLSPKGSNELDILAAALNEMAESLQRAEFEHKRYEERLRLAENVFENSEEAIIVTDSANKIVSANPAFVRITGYKMEDVIGKDPRIMGSGKHDKEFFRGIWESLNRTGTWQGEIWDRRKNGEVYPKWLSISTVKHESGGVDKYIGIFSDISELKKAEERLDYMAHFDSLTGLPNRLLLKDRTEQSIAASLRSKNQTAILFLDLDNFKNINDSLGHNFGDALLQAVSERLKNALRKSDTIARIGGDEFIILLSDIEGSDDVAMMARRLAESMREPFELQNRTQNITTSIGISLYPNDGSDYDTLIKNADTAMYRAKEVGRNTYQFFTQEMNDRVFERLFMENNLRRAIEREEFMLYYQPQVDIATGEIIGIEALIRWQHPEMGLVPPARFIHIAEESGLIVPIGEWVLHAAGMQNKKWQKAGLPAVPIAVNLSAVQFRQGNLLEIIQKAIREADIDPHYLELEITEMVVMRNVKEAVEIMQKMKTMGLKLSIDDFGTGYSSLNYLKQFPIDKLKIDQSFVRDITIDPNDAAITLAVISMAHSLGLRVIAEGVETAEQLAFLKKHRCDEIQGYYISKPLPADEFSGLLREKIRL
jgi:diguanylate cyclase (GGDEF)-like protein/PAS domain S-box-containing protein